jgi:hypothetical protein
MPPANARSVAGFVREVERGLEPAEAGGNCSLDQVFADQTDGSRRPTARSAQLS